MKSLKAGLVAALASLCLFATQAHAQTPHAKIGVVKLGGSIPLYIGIEKGYFKDEGLDAELVWFPSSVPLITAMMAGEIDFGSAGFSAGLFNLGAKGQLKVIASQLRDAPGFRLNALMATKGAYDKGFKTMSDIAGKRFATTSVGSTTDYIVGVLSKQMGYDLSKVELVPTQSIENQNAAFAGGTVDGGMMAAAAANRFVANGSGVILAWTGDLMTWQVGGQVTTPKAIKDKPEVVQKFVRAYQKGIATYLAAVSRSPSGELVKGPGYDEVITIVAKYLTLKPEDVPGVLTSFYPNGELDVPSMDSQLRFYQGLNQVDKNAKIESMIDTSFLKKN